MTQPTTKPDEKTPCGKDCDSCGKGETCEALTPVLAQIAPQSKPEAASWK